MEGTDVTPISPKPGRFLRWIGRTFLKIMGWTLQGEPPDVARAVMIAAPHTSNWDFIYMLAAAWACGIQISWFGKNSLFKGFRRPIMRYLGGVSIDRSRAGGVVEQMATRIRTSDRILVAVPPSGTRSRRDTWKSGFYWIARTADVPVACSFLDYSKKVLGFGPLVHLTGDVHSDMEVFRAFYRDVRGKFPDRETTLVLKEELEHREEQGEPSKVG